MVLRRAAATDFLIAVRVAARHGSTGRLQK
jgi:hypothetical protein